MLALSPRIGLIHEPFSPITPPGISSAPFDRFFRYVTEENEGPYVEPFERLLDFRYGLGRQLATIRTPRDVGRTAKDLGDFAASRRRRSRPLLKDPIAVFSSEWLASRFDAQVIVLIRHPAAFVSSVKRLGWTHDFALFLDQPLLLRDHLAPFEDEIRDFAEHERDQIDQAILLWRLIYHTVGTFRDRHPDWTFVRHEDLSREPVPGFESLFATLGVEIDDGIRRAIAGAQRRGESDGAAREARRAARQRREHRVVAAAARARRDRADPGRRRRRGAGVLSRRGLVVRRGAVGQRVQHPREPAPLAVEVDERRQHSFEARLLDDPPPVLPGRG